MEHHRIEEMDWQPAGEEHFTGQVWFGPVHPSASPETLNVIGVRFDAGARSDWHSHPAGQVLHVVSGTARVHSEGSETITARPGDSVVADPGEVHWHGAAPDGPMIHLSITDGGPTGWLARKVTDAEYED